MIATLLFLSATIGLIGYGSLLLYFRKGLFRLHPAPPSEDLPTVSLVVPCHNEETHLPTLLAALDRQTYPPERLEILLVDDHSTDATSEMMTSFAKERPFVQVIQIRTEGDTPSKKVALSRAIEQAHGEIIVTTDADAIPPPDWLRALASYFCPGVDVVLGYVAFRTDGPYDTLFHRLLALEFFSLAAVSAAGVGMGFFITGSAANLAYRRSLFERIGGFGETLQWHSGDDDLLLHRFQKMARPGFAYALGDASRIVTAPPSNFKRFFRQRVRFASKHLAYPPLVVAGLMLIYAFYFSLLGLGLLALGNPAAAVRFGLLFALKVLLDLSFLLPARRLPEPRNLIGYYPLAVIPHLGYVVLFPLLGQLLPKRW